MSCLNSNAILERWRNERISVSHRRLLLRKSTAVRDIGIESSILRCSTSKLGCWRSALAISESGQEAAELDRLPKTIGEYEIVRPIGSGGMGNVYLARQTKLGREVALKVLANHRLVDSRNVERFAAEMRAVGRLSHPNIVTAYDAREVDGTAVLVTEFVSGLDLGQLLQRTGPLKVADACEIARRVAVALAYINSQGFVHRDIKPSNVMLNDDGEIKLLDLGLARLQFGENERTELTATGQAMGTADYVAPEQVTDSKTFDIRADIYSLGCTLFKLLAGRAPFADDQHLTTFAKMTAHVSETPLSLGALLPTAPRSLVQLVDSMLAKRPADRPTSPQQIAVALVPHCKEYDLKTLMLGFKSKNSALGTGDGEKISSFTDGTANTLLVVEAACSVPWTKPQDIPQDASQAQFFDDHPFTYLMADGSVRSGAQIPEEILNKMISRDGGEVLETIGKLRN